MKKLALVVGPGSEAMIDKYSDHQVFGSVGCPEHKIVAIVAVPRGASLDVDCALQTLSELMRRIVRQAEEPEYEN